MQLCSSLSILWHSLLWDWNENWPFPVLWPLLSFQNLLAYWVQHFTASSSRIWNSSTGIPSPPLALFAVMLSKAYSTSHSRMSGFQDSRMSFQFRFFSFLMARTSNILLNKSGQSGNLCLFSCFIGNAFSFSLLNMMLAMACHIQSFLCWGIFPV